MCINSLIASKYCIFSKFCGKNLTGFQNLSGLIYFLAQDAERCFSHSQMELGNEEKGNLKFYNPHKLWARIVYFNHDPITSAKDIHNIIKPLFDDLEN